LETLVLDQLLMHVPQELPTLIKIEILVAAAALDLLV
jgi:hypothetical protein